MASLPPLFDKNSQRRALRATRAAFVATLDSATRMQLMADLATRALPQLRDYKSVATYHACGDEIDPVLIIDALRQRGVVVAFPRVADDGARLSFHACADSVLVPGFKGIMEPPAAAPEVAPECVLVPLIGIDLSGNRIGQGAGHYDRTLAQRRTRTLGLAWDVQVVNTIACDSWDQPLDALATPTRLVAWAGKPFYCDR